MPTKKPSSSKKRSKVKVGKLQGPAKELSAKEQKKVKGGKSYRISVNKLSGQ